MTRRTSVILALLCLLLPPAIFFGQFWLFTRQAVTPATAVRISVTPGMSVLQLSDRLQSAGVIDGRFNFRLLDKLKGTPPIKSGIYEFVKPATPAEVLRRLASGDVLLKRLTVPEGFTLKEIAARLESLGFGPVTDTLRLGRDPGFLETLGLQNLALEGYLFPETYFVPVDATPRQILQLMHREFRKRLNPEMIAAARSAGLSPHQLVTLASIVQKEARRIEEMPTIASVYHNRLRLRMPLQADPTVIYGIPDFNGNITRADLLRFTPYNTYRIPGLPPGPIASPGSDALQAAAFPAKTRYLYFVARGDGSHAFSETLSQHNAAVRRYQLRRAARK